MSGRQHQCSGGRWEVGSRWSGHHYRWWYDRNFGFHRRHSFPGHRLRENVGQLGIQHTDAARRRSNPIQPSVWRRQWATHAGDWVQHGRKQRCPDVQHRDITRGSCWQHQRHSWTWDRGYRWADYHDRWADYRGCWDWRLTVVGVWLHATKIKWGIQCAYRRCRHDWSERRPSGCHWRCFRWEQQRTRSADRLCCLRGWWKHQCKRRKWSVRARRARHRDGGTCQISTRRGSVACVRVWITEQQRGVQHQNRQCGQSRGQWLLGSVHQGVHFWK